jgi:hypothetical protein
MESESYTTFRSPKILHVQSSENVATPKVESWHGSKNANSRERSTAVYFAVVYYGNESKTTTHSTIPRHAPNPCYDLSQISPI